MSYRQIARQLDIADATAYADVQEQLGRLDALNVSTIALAIAVALLLLIAAFASILIRAVRRRFSRSLRES